MNINNTQERSADDLRNKAYDAVDIFLKNLIAKELSNHDLKLPPYSSERTIAMDVMLNHSLIYLRSGDRNSSIVDIKEKGIAVVEMGGIRVFLESLEERNNDASQIQKLTKQILEIQLQNKEKDEALNDIQTKLGSLQLENYPATKKMAEEADRVGKRGLSISRISM